jgi:hypothetical protein
MVFVNMRGGTCYCRQAKERFGREIAGTIALPRQVTPPRKAGLPRQVNLPPQVNSENSRAETLVWRPAEGRLEI